MEEVGIEINEYEFYDIESSNKNSIRNCYFRIRKIMIHENIKKIF